MHQKCYKCPKFFCQYLKERIFQYKSPARNTGVFLIYISYFNISKFKYKSTAAPPAVYLKRFKKDRDICGAEAPHIISLYWKAYMSKRKRRRRTITHDKERKICKAPTAFRCKQYSFNDMKLIPFVYHKNSNIIFYKFDIDIFKTYKGRNYLMTHFQLPFIQVS